MHATIPATPSDVKRVSPAIERVIAEKVPSAQPPLAFVRDLPEAEGVARTSAPWANGMAKSRTYGPFLDASGVHRWVDLIIIEKTFSIVRGPSNAPLCYLQIKVPIFAP